MKKIPVVTGVKFQHNKAVCVGSYPIRAHQSHPCLQFIRETARARGVPIPESVFITAGVVFYEKGKIEVQACGYYQSGVPKDKSVTEDPYFQTSSRPPFFWDEESQRGGLNASDGARKHLAYFALDRDGLPTESAWLYWNVEPTIQDFDTNIFEQVLLDISFRDSSSRLDDYAQLLRSKEGIEVLEDLLGHRSETELLELLRPIPPTEPSSDSKITIIEGNEDFTYTYKRNVLAYDLAVYYFKTIEFSESVNKERAKEWGWSYEQIKAVAAVDFILAINDFVAFGLTRHDDYVKKAIQIMVKHLIGSGFPGYALFNFESDYTTHHGSKPDLRTDRLDILFDDIRKLYETSTGRPKGATHKKGKNYESDVVEIAQAINDILNSRVLAGEPTTKNITQEEVSAKIGISARMIRKRLRDSGIKFKELREEID